MAGQNRGQRFFCYEAEREAGLFRRPFPGRLRFLQKLHGKIGCFRKPDLSGFDAGHIQNIAHEGQKDIAGEADIIGPAPDFVGRGPSGDQFIQRHHRV